MNEVIKKRILSIDILRGLVMVVMALDHVRDFFHEDAMLHNPLDLATTMPLLFFTRWITHFCAPIFLFLSGLSAGLSAMNKNRKDASAFLIKRGLWLVVVEIVVITLGLTFNPFYNFIILQVIWATGWSMVLLGIFIRFSDKLVLITGFILVTCHNIFDYISFPEGTILSSVVKVFITSNAYVVPTGHQHFLGFFYAILPWTGIMMLGYSIAKWFVNYDPARRRKLLIYSGLSALILFIVLRLINRYGDPVPEVHQLSFVKNILSFINVNKYPPSLEYTLITVGTALILLALFENIKNKFSSIAMVYGKVPFFYYVIHFYIIHTLLVIIFFASGYTAKDIIPKANPFLFRPENFGFGLGIVYIIWLSVVAVLYKPCKWFARYKETHKVKWWVHYL